YRNFPRLERSSNLLLGCNCKPHERGFTSQLVGIKICDMSGARPVTNRSKCYEKLSTTLVSRAKMSLVRAPKSKESLQHRRSALVIQPAPDFEKAACKCQTEDCEIIDFKASLFISKRKRFNEWKTGFRTKSLRLRMV